MRYAVKPGLYALGGPDSHSDVFVTANYKLSFDMLRRALRGVNAWMLVLDTKGINVWCAAGKGTFGTDELVKRITEVRLDTVVSHKRIILPQFGAVGVNAAQVQKRTGFRVAFGPVRAGDISDYVSAGYTKTDAMRTVKFTMLDRLELTPMEINPAMKRFPLFALIILLISGLQPSGILFRDAWTGGLPFLVLGLTAIVGGAFVTPLLLPFVPFRSFAVKGWIVGMLTASLTLNLIESMNHGHTVIRVAQYLFFPLASSYLALQFTGSTTFTGMSGVKKELKTALPVYLTATVVSVILLILYKLHEWKIL